MRYLLYGLIIGALTLLPLTVHAQPLPVNTAAGQLESTANQARSASGVPSLSIDSRLETSAQGKLSAMQSSGCYLQRCTNELNVTERATAAGYPPGGVLAELINSRDTTPDAVVATWLADGGNSFLLLHPSFVAIGCAAAPPLWVCDLGQFTGTVSATNTPSLPTSTPRPPTATRTSVPATNTPTPSTAPLGTCLSLWEDPQTGVWELNQVLDTRAGCLH